MTWKKVEEKGAWNFSREDAKQKSLANHGTFSEQTDMENLSKYKQLRHWRNKVTGDRMILFSDQLENPHTQTKKVK